MVLEGNYNTDKNIKISPHFSWGEFASIVNGKLTTNKILINMDLIYMLEKMIKCLGASKAIITSAYRNQDADIIVGGNGKGQHTLGNAVDIIFYDNNNTAIDTKIVSCLAQDLGFGGIARISDKAIHLDVRNGARYLGDETKGTNSVTTNFYNYYNMNQNYVRRNAVSYLYNLSNVTIGYINEYKWNDDLLYKLLAN